MPTPRQVLTVSIYSSCLQFTRDNLSKEVRNAIRTVTVEGVGEALVRRQHHKLGEKIKKTVSVDSKTADQLNQVSLSIGLSNEETARLMLEAYLYESCSGFCQVEEQA